MSAEIDQFLNYLYEEGESIFLRGPERGKLLQPIICQYLGIESPKLYDNAYPYNLLDT